MHRRPLGRGRTLAALGGALMVIGCVLPWWHVGGPPDLSAESGNGLAGSAILVFLAGIATLALVALPYAAGDRPVGVDRWLSFALLAGAGWIGLAWRVVELAQIGAFEFRSPDQVVTNGPGLWVAGIGLVMLSRACWTMSREPTYR